MFAVYDKTGKTIVSGLGNKTKAWNAFLIKRVGYVSSNPSIRASFIASYRRDGFRCDTFVKDSTTTAPKSAIKFSHVVEINKDIVLDINFAKAMHKFFKAKQDAGKIKFIYEYKSYGSGGDAKQLLADMTEFLTEYSTE